MTSTLKFSTQRQVQCKNQPPAMPVLAMTSSRNSSDIGNTAAGSSKVATGSDGITAPSATAMAYIQKEATINQQ